MHPQEPIIVEGLSPEMTILELKKLVQVRGRALQSLLEHLFILPVYYTVRALAGALCKERDVLRPG